MEQMTKVLDQAVGRSLDSDVVAIVGREESPSLLSRATSMRISEWEWSEFRAAAVEVAYLAFMGIVGFVVAFMIVFVWCCV
jgi:hypothetical protein